MCNDENVKSSELCEEQLENVAGGCPTQNRYNPAGCKNIGEPKFAIDA